MNKSFWQNRKVLVTGHTGFMGGWLTIWLNSLSAKVTGIALKPDTTPSLFTAAKIAELCDSHFVDINDYKTTSETIENAAPEIIFHLAAQPLVLPSYDQPLNTFSTNVMGTAHVLEANRHLKNPAAVTLVVTSDKCYENRESGQAYKESDPLGGFDPYSASKGAAEIVVSACRRSFYQPKNLSLISARAGNIIGGGDWANYRLFPDVANHLSKGSKVILRNPEAIRPWQHVLDPLNVYLQLAERAFSDRQKYSRAYNIGPDPKNEKSVLDLVQLACNTWGKPDAFEIQKDQNARKEANLLHIDSSLIHHDLNWRPLLSFQQTVEWTTTWYKDFYNHRNARDLCLDQISRCRGLPSKRGPAHP